MTLKEMPKVGEKVCFIGRGSTTYHSDVTVGEVYEITWLDGHGYAHFIDDRNDEDYNSYISEDYFGCFELVTEESPLTESDLIANLALRVAKLERDEYSVEAVAERVANGVNTMGYSLSDITPIVEDTTQAERIQTVCNEVSALLIRKNHDYGDSFSKQYAKYGLLSGLIRMDDKMRRLETLTGGSEAEVDESIEDTLLDLCGYALLTLVELRKQNDKGAIK